MVGAGTKRVDAGRRYLQITCNLRGLGEVVKTSENVRKGNVCIGIEKDVRFTTRTGHPARATAFAKVPLIW